METFFRDLTLAVCSSLDVYEALERALPVLRSSVPAAGLGLGYSDLERQRMEVVAWVGEQPPWRRPDQTAFELGAEGSQYIAFDGTQAPSPLIVSPNDVSPGLLALFPGLRSQSAIFLRLMLAGEEVGALIVWGADRFRPSHADLLVEVTEPLTLVMVNAQRRRELLRLQARLVEDHRALVADVTRSFGTEIVGADFGLRGVMELVRRIAPSDRPALLLGETGTGKEVIAHALHAVSPRSEGPFISLQCGAVPDTLLDSELFGHEKGAFTGASTRKRGRFERANGGTLFLDEVGELTPEAQVKLLRVLQEGVLERLGGDRPVPVDVRVVAATHRDLEGMVAEGRFREDLWYRLCVLPIRIPPLRERRDDIPSLVHHVAAKRAREVGLATPRVAAGQMDRLMAYDWPGNVRELQNVVERALVLSTGDVLEFPLLQPTGRVTTGSSVPVPLDTAIAEHIRSALAYTRGQVAGRGGAADLLKVKPSTLRNRMKKLGLL